MWLALAAEDIGGKILGIFFPITAFVAMGFDHVVANMFFLPAAMFAHVPGLTWGHVVNNLVFAFIGNAIGAVVFVACTYWYLHLRGRPAGRATAGDSDAGERGAVPDRTAHADDVYPADATTASYGRAGTGPGNARHGSARRSARHPLAAPAPGPPSGPPSTGVHRPKSAFRMRAWTPVVMSTTCETVKSVAALR